MDVQKDDANGYHISQAYTAEELTDYEAMRRKVLYKMLMFSHHTHSICEYEIVYDTNENDIKVVLLKGKPQKDKMYFKSINDAYICILTVGENNIKKYYFEKEV